MFGDEVSVRKRIKIEQEGKYQLRMRFEVDGSFEYTPARNEITFSVDDKPLHQGTYVWCENKHFYFDFTDHWSAGEHDMEFQFQPLPPAETREGDVNQNASVRFSLEEFVVEGPGDLEKWKHPPNYERFFPDDEPPAEEGQRRAYARRILSAFVAKAYRQPADPRTLDRLVSLAEARYSQPGKTFEDGVAQAFVAILASPRFLFRLENVEPNGDDEFPEIDQFALAARLSYLLWSSMPDDELMQLAAEGQLRANLESQLRRMIADDRSGAFVRNFVGQWLRARDVTTVSINALAAAGVEGEYQELRQKMRRRFRNRSEDASEAEKAERARYQELREIRDRFDGSLRRAMRSETEMLFEYIVKEDRSLLELIDCDYTFLNEQLAGHYGIDGVDGEDMRRVDLPTDSPRGGVLAQGTMLTVTSNPTRTSPVKRGLFILDSILGTPAPPAPPDVPEIDEAAKQFGDREPQFREVLALHREAALCSSCHSRMDPLGLALENFNALGTWRETERGEPIDASGQLITGETFRDVRDLKKILATEHRSDFYRCITKKMLTYSLGRGLDFHDEHTVDTIVDRLEVGEGKFSVLLQEVVKSAPFQRTRRHSD